MTPTLKVGIALASALLIGLVVGYGLGAAGRGDLEQAAKKAQVNADDAEAALKQLQDQQGKKAKKFKTSKLLLRAKEHLLRAALELYANNYGLTSQHLALARKRLRSAKKGLKKRHAKRASELYDRIGQAQTLAMRLDPTARVHIEQILAALQKIPGAR
jgi:hypothetical protein